MTSEYHLHEIDHVQDPLLDLVDQDPVRHHIPKHVRVGTAHRVLVLLKQSEPQSVVCVAFCDQVGVSEHDLFTHASTTPQVAMLYTIWSLAPGAGRRMVHACVDYVKQSWPTVQRVVTLSPPTQMAERFHLNNGAHMLQHNQTTVNFEYDLR
jgi:hypothetical protein